MNMYELKNFLKTIWRYSRQKAFPNFVPNLDQGSAKENVLLMKPPLQPLDPKTVTLLCITQSLLHAVLREFTSVQIKVRGHLLPFKTFQFCRIPS